MSKTIFLSRSATNRREQTKFQKVAGCSIKTFQSSGFVPAHRHFRNAVNNPTTSPHAVRTVPTRACARSNSTPSTPITTILILVLSRSHQTIEGWTMPALPSGGIWHRIQEALDDRCYFNPVCRKFWGGGFVLKRCVCL